MSSGHRSRETSEVENEDSPPYGRLVERARLYVRSAGPARIGVPRRFVTELPAGALWIPLRADGVEFDLVSAASGTVRARVEPAVADDDAIESWARMLTGSLPVPIPQVDPSTIESATEQLSEAIAVWYRRECEAEEASAAEAAIDDARDIESAERLLASVGDTHATPLALTATGEPLLIALELIGQRDGILIRRPAAAADGGRLDEQLGRIALASSFRFREVTLDGRWWREEGPSVLVSRADSHEPLAAVWSRGRFHLVDPSTHRGEVIDEEVAAELAPYGYQIYATLPDVVTKDSVRHFGLYGAAPEIRAMLVASVLSMLAGLVIPVATGAIVSTAIPDGRVGLLMQLALLVASAGVGAGGFIAIRALSTIRVSTRIDMRLQAAVWDRVLRLPTGFFRRFSTGDLVQRVLAVDTMRRIVTGPVLNGLLNGVFAGASFLLMLFYDVRLAIYGLVFAGLIAVVLFLFAQRQVAFLQQFRDAQGRVTATVVDLLVGVNKLRLAAAEERAFARWAEAFASQERANFQAGRIQVGQRLVGAILPSLGILGMMAVAGFRSAPLALGPYAAFNVAFGQFVAAVSSLTLAMGSALQAIPLLRRAIPIFVEKPEVDEAREEPPPLSGRIAVRNLSFRYRSEGLLILDGVDFSIEPGEFVAIVGPSGAGKSTIVRLLLGFETAENGAVYYDDRDLSTLDVRLVRRAIGTVLQSAKLTPGSLYENIAGAAKLSDDEVMEAARQAGLAEDIAHLPMGLDTFVTEDGGTFSGGQRQRIMIARALSRKPSILIFDEATSALDNRTQAIVSESLDGLHVTRVVIAHRLSTIRNADKILVLEGGRVVESGDYDELMKRRGPFYELAERQLS